MKRRKFLTHSSAFIGGMLSLANANDIQDTRSRSTILITGGTSGIGEATARYLASKGYNVVFCGRREKLGAKIEAEIRKAGHEATYIKCDITKDVEVGNLIENAIKKYRNIDYAFLNAGISLYSDRLHNVSMDQLRTLFETNCFGTFNCTKKLLPHFLNNKKGLIIFNSTYGATRAIHGGSAYSASKASIDSFVKHIAIDYAKDNIQVYSILPLAVRTKPIEEKAAALNLSVEKLGNRLIKRIIEPKEIANLVEHLISLETPVLSGSTFDLSAGFSHGFNLIFSR